MHADRPGDRPRLLYWYRTAPGILQGRTALDEDAIRAIEEQHPDIEFDWPAILALSEVMTPEDEAPSRPQQQSQRREKKPRGRDRDRGRDGDRDSASGRPNPDELRRDDRDDESPVAVAPVERLEPGPVESEELVEPAEPSRSGLVDELAGREIARRLRTRHAEIVSRIEALDVEGHAREAWFKRAEAIDPDAWESPEAVLQGVSQADAVFEKLKTDLGTL